MADIPLPAYAYVPGQTPRHAEGDFDLFHDSVSEGIALSDLPETLAWRAGLIFYEQGFFWEAHEVLEPVWMVTPRGSAEHQMVQALIQLANAALKARMGRPAAARRLCDLASGHARAARSAGGSRVMSMDVAQLDGWIDSLARCIQSD